jgi:hypothetical protein
MRFNVTNITADLLPSAGSLPREGSEALPDAAEGGYAILFAPSPSIALFAEEPFFLSPTIQTFLSNQVQDAGWLLLSWLKAGFAKSTQP